MHFEIWGKGCTIPCKCQRRDEARSATLLGSCSMARMGGVNVRSISKAAEAVRRLSVDAKRVTSSV